MPGPSERGERARVITHFYRVARANFRYYFHYTPEVLDKMNIRQVVEAWEDLLYIRSKLPPTA